MSGFSFANARQEFSLVPAIRDISWLDIRAAQRRDEPHIHGIDQDNLGGSRCPELLLIPMVVSDLEQAPTIGIELCLNWSVRLLLNPIFRVTIDCAVGIRRESHMP